jgi:MFS family permease
MSINNNEIHRKRLLWAGFVAILAAGVGFGIRGGIFANWAADFGFSGAQLGAVGGAGFTGFCFGIMIGGVVVDKIGYGKLVVAAFLFHILSAFITFGATQGQDSETAYQFLFWGMFVFALANGTLEAVANPLVATLFPENRNHYLNILHASWPLGMILGGMVGWFLGGDGGWGWKGQLALYLVPTLVYGIMFLGQKFPQSEASAKGLKFGEMLKDVGILGGLVVSFMLYLFFQGTLAPFFEAGSSAPRMISLAIGLATLLAIGAMTKFSIGHWLIFVLFITHALVGAVELGTDGWIQNITGAILSEQEGKMLFVFTSLVMFLLRFCAHFIEKKAGLNPISLLFICAVLGCIGLNLVSAVTAFGPALGALLVYAIGKTFFWPTMLAVVGDRFPATGAVAMSLMGGIGMMSAGLIGSPGLGYFKDRYASEELNKADTALHAEWKDSEKQSSFLMFDAVDPIDAKRLAEAKGAAVDERTEAQATVVAADIEGNRRTLKVDSLIPAAMAVIYLFLIFYFRAKGGYKPVELADSNAKRPVAQADEF